MTAGRPRTDYERAGRGYASRRVADPRIAARVHAALGDARTVLNVGAGAGSYEPGDRWVLAVEPAAAMRAERPPGAAPCLAASAEALPLDDASVDAAMAMITVHHWEDGARRGLAELRRVARGPVVVLTFDIDAGRAGWVLGEYVPEAHAVERAAFGTPEEVAAALGGRTRIEHVPVPGDCTDGFVSAYETRPEAMLEADVRAGQSVWSRLPAGVEERFVAELRADLASGAWDARHPGLREAGAVEGGLRLVVSEPGG